MVLYLVLISLGNNVPNARFAYKTSHYENTFYFRKASFPIRDSFEAPCRHSLFQVPKKIKYFFHLYEIFLKPIHLLLTINRQNIKIEQQKRILFDLFCNVRSECSSRFFEGSELHEN